MTIKPQDYAEALLVQDASNLSGVVHSFVSVLERIGKFFEESKDPQLPFAEMNRHPIATLYASKIANLTGVQGEEGTPDRRETHGLELLVAAQALSFVITQLRTLGAAHLLPTDNKSLHHHPLCQAFARNMEQLTGSGSMQTFSLAYEACQAGRDWEGEEEVPASETWLHRVMSPSADEIAKVGLDWRCADCGVAGETIELRYESPTKTFVCPHCCKPAIVPLTAILTAELKDPEALAAAIRLHLDTSAR
jgi:hypothetical protein